MTLYLDPWDSDTESKSYKFDPPDTSSEHKSGDFVIIRSKNPAKNRPIT